MRAAFDRLAHGWDATHGPKSPHARKFQERSRYLRGVCEAHGAPRVLDVGCGTGLYLFALADTVAEAVGLDLSPEMIARAEKARRESGPCRHSHLRFTVASAETLTADWGRFDIILFAGSLEHMPDPAQVLRRLPPLLAPEGEVVAVMRHRWHPPTTLRRWLGREEEVPWHFHSSPAALRRLAESAGLRCISIASVGNGFWPRVATASGLSEVYAAHLVRAGDQP